MCIEKPHWSDLEHLVYTSGFEIVRSSISMGMALSVPGSSGLLCHTRKVCGLFIMGLIPIHYEGFDVSSECCRSKLKRVQRGTGAYATFHGQPALNQPAGESEDLAPGMSTSTSFSILFRARGFNSHLLQQGAKLSLAKFGDVYYGSFIGHQRVRCASQTSTRGLHAPILAVAYFCHRLSWTAAPHVSK